MPVLINFKICDNSQDCSGIEVCPTKAFYWDEETKTIAVNNSECNICGKCESECPVGAIKVARTDEEFKKIKNEIDEDLRNVSDLFIDRYGAEPISPAFNVPKEKFEIQILKSCKLAVVEFFNGDSIRCLLHSIPIKALFKDSDIKYRKIEVDDELKDKYNVKELPALLFFKDRNLVDKIEGYYRIGKKRELLEKIKNISFT